MTNLKSLALFDTIYQKVQIESPIIEISCQIDSDSIRGLIDELIETEELEKKEVTLREYLDGLEMVSISVEACGSLIMPNKDHVLSNIFFLSFQLIPLF